MEQSNYLNPPKKEEEAEDEENLGQVPDTYYNIKAHPEEDESIIDDLEGILGIENLPGDAGSEGMQLSCSNYIHVNWEDEFSTTQLIQEAELWDGNGCNDDKVKPESSYGYWDFDDKKGSLNLSLNYKEVLEAWSNRGPLWVPSDSYMGEVPVMEEEQGIHSRRQASVMRYKEKRQSRLFSKKIRYEVRKLNADKRPRIKGRFVKRFGDKMLKRC